MNILTVKERQAVADIQGAYDKLSDNAKAEVAKGVSWAERHLWDTVLIAFGCGVAAAFTALILL